MSGQCKSNTTGFPCGAGSSYSSGALPTFLWDSQTVVQSSVFCVFYKSMAIAFRFFVVFYKWPRCKCFFFISDYPLGLFCLFSGKKEKF